MKSTKRARREAKRLFRLCRVNGRLDEDRARQVVERISQARSRGSLGLLGQFQRWVELDLSRHTATVESAASLPAEFQVGVQAKLLQVYGPEVSTSFALRPALIGGMRIKVGFDVYDASVQAKLAVLEAGL